MTGLLTESKPLIEAIAKRQAKALAGEIKDQGDSKSAPNLIKASN